MEVLAMTAVIYARYSSDNQREESIEGQIRECTAYAEKNGITIVKHYDDKVWITFNYTEGTQTVTFGEATEVTSKENGSDLDCIPAPQGRQLLIAVFFVLHGSFLLAVTAGNMDTGCVELLLRDGRKISIDCTGVEDALVMSSIYYLVLIDQF